MAMIRRIIAPKDVHVPIPETCVTLAQNGYLAKGAWQVKLRLLTLR